MAAWSEGSPGEAAHTHRLETAGKTRVRTLPPCRLG